MYVFESGLQLVVASKKLMKKTSDHKLNYQIVYIFLDEEMKIINV